MQNIKIIKNLIWESFWPHITSVLVKWIPEEKEIPSDLSTEEKEEIIQSWDNIAVLRVKCNNPVKFYFGFSNLSVIQYLKYEFSTDMEFWVRVGPDDIRFFVFPVDLESEISLELIEITNENNDKYKDLILI
ncbi:MAG: hypothetical protein ACD_3C00003G0001 [uncultured bacterium (gcode 4)]|uniref:Uncharacterized protein n=1 Tax=uncultured bacterium (gcode 4) TaxID=1234023 RepID=K2G3D9_9BACT|nr:MAG: hypothetical protein ACD_3C00003G0001 [uncultured bacterium (gcode 4)]